MESSVAMTERSQTENGANINLSPSYQHARTNGRPSEEIQTQQKDEKPTNEYVLNVAFFSFFGFMLLQAGFAIMVGSQSMLADSEAMGVDAMTYLFNLCAERIKNAPYSSKELLLPASVREYKRTLKRLYLELIPPLISVSTLIAVTIVTLHDALETLFGKDVEEETDQEGDQMVGVMLFFSTLNLLLDVVNVTCFARADQAYVKVLQVQEVEEDFKQSLGARSPSEDLSLLATASPASRVNEVNGGTGIKELNVHGSNGSGAETTSVSEEETPALVNLNMCSAWTHVCADTMRSIAVLVAAAIAYLFDAVAPDVADATAAVVVSLIIIISLLPLLQGLYLTAMEIWILTRQPPGDVNAGVSLTV